MISPKKLIRLARKCQQAATGERKRITLTRTNSTASKTGGQRIACKGHFVAYTREGARFMVPLAFLGSDIFKELFRMAEEEFGLPGSCPITLPCDTVFMEKALEVLRRQLSHHVEKMFVNHMVTAGCSSVSSFPAQGSEQPCAFVHGF